MGALFWASFLPLGMSTRFDIFLRTMQILTTSASVHCFGACVVASVQCVLCSGNCVMCLPSTSPVRDVDQSYGMRPATRGTTCLPLARILFARTPALRLLKNNLATRTFRPFIVLCVLVFGTFCRAVPCTLIVMCMHAFMSCGTLVFLCGILVCRYISVDINLTAAAPGALASSFGLFGSRFVETPHELLFKVRPPGNR